MSNGLQRCDDCGEIVQPKEHKCIGPSIPCSDCHGVGYHHPPTILFRVDLCDSCIGKGKIPVLGRWAVCSKGRLGRITGRKELPWGLSFVGKGVEGSDWASREPTFLNAKESLLLDEKLERAWAYEDLST